MAYIYCFSLLTLFGFLGFVTASSDLNNEIYNVIYGLPNLFNEPNAYDHSFCPDPNTISPCTCEKECEACQSRIQCLNIKNIVQLKEVFQKSGDYPFELANFGNIIIMYFPADSFITKKFRSLYIYNSTQVSLFDVPPSSNSILYSLSLKSLHLQRSIEWELFSAFRELSTLSIVDVPLHKIKNNVGDILPKQLTHISLQNTRTETLDDSVFAPLKQLSYIDLSYNLIKDVKRSMFPRPYVGTMISLDNNKIENLPDDFLQDMPLITGLELSNNSLTTVSESVFKNLPTSLRAIFFEGNPINCDCKMQWLTKQPMIYLSGQCISPTHNKGKELSTLKPSDFPYC